MALVWCTDRPLTGDLWYEKEAKEKSLEPIPWKIHSQNTCKLLSVKFAFSFLLTLHGWIQGDIMLKELTIGFTFLLFATVNHFIWVTISLDWLLSSKLQSLFFQAGFLIKLQLTSTVWSDDYSLVCRVHQFLTFKRKTPNKNEIRPVWLSFGRVLSRSREKTFITSIINLFGRSKVKSGLYLQPCWTLESGHFIDQTKLVDSRYCKRLISD